MAIYTPEQINIRLAEKDVSDYMKRRERRRGLCCGGCRSEVPLNQDADFLVTMKWAMEGLSLDNFPIVEPRFVMEEWHPREVECGYESQSARRALDPNDNRFSEELRSIYDVLAYRPVVQRKGGWMLAEGID
jgi:hypothetical protein